MEAYFDLGGLHLQFNVVDRATLVKARERPEAHRDLMVRVAGYNAYFVLLPESEQRDIIRRCEA
jgi:formate C-acetyltransferase